MLNTWKRSKRVVGALGLGSAGLLAAAAILLGAGPAFGKVQRDLTIHVATPTVITVTAGKPTELGFKLSKFSNIKPGKITFKVTDGGLGFHDFKICTTPTTSLAKNACVGKATVVLHPKKSATLTVTLTKIGKYEYLCTVTGHAAAGMKGLIGVGVAVSKSASVAQTTTSSSPGLTSTPATTVSNPGSTTTTTPTGTVADHSQDSSCPNGSTIKQTGAGADGDGDEAGDVSDGDGCL